ncbi:Type 1 glutamine amidotransferase-like domain-containing protein [Candidatus Collierbacteria bacterium]|nr:Type 1 glutamine amidotransferase-like domain-containing protein [Candidatus Collierbacteria bacterium]
MSQLFLASSADYVLNDIVKHLSNKPSEYNLAFINTAAEIMKGGNHWWVAKEKNKLLSVGFQVDEFSITKLSQSELESKMADKNGIYICGGNTYYLLDQVIKTGFNKFLKKWIEEGKLYIGSSAGSMIVGIDIDLIPSDEAHSAPGLKSRGLGIIDLAIVPHWGSSDFRDEYLKDISSLYRENAKIILLSNSQYLHVRGDTYSINQV